MVTGESLKAMEKMMAQLIEDHRKREEIADECVQREKEREAREREVKRQMDTMQSHMDKLMQMVEESKTPTAVNAASELTGV